jgi:threonine/homoserine/homoserine lactone efflux protein
MEKLFEPMNSAAWIAPLFSGISFGLLLAIMLGPVFFTLLQTSLHEGFRAGTHLALGVMLSDAAVIAACYFFASLLKTMDSHHKIMSIVGGVLMIGFGVFNFFHKIKLKEVDDDKKTVHTQFILKGFLLNLLNPAVFFFWLGVVGLIKSREEYKPIHEAIFLGATITTVFSTDLLKSYVANRIKNILKPNVMVWINRAIGVVLVGFGVSMLWG